MVYRVVKHPVRRPETKQSNCSLHKNALQNVAPHVMPKFVGQYRFDLVRSVVVEQGVGEDDAASRAHPSQSRIRLLAFFGKFPAVDAAHASPSSLAATPQST